MPYDESRGSHLPPPLSLSVSALSPVCVCVCVCVCVFVSFLLSACPGERARSLSQPRRGNAQCKINVNVQDSAGDTALHDAARFGHLPVVHELIKYGADIKLTNNKGETARDTAAAYHKDDVVAALRTCSSM